jgi:exopolysaccharide production protein ExoQ
MPPRLASVLTLGFMIWLFRRDLREQLNVTGALWLPTLWLVIAASRPVTTWLNMLGLPMGGPIEVEEGSPLDALVYAGLIAAGFYVLSKRGVDLSKVTQENPWLTVFLVYCFLAIFWSDFPFVSFKRWIKIVGHPIMALVLFTEPDPKEALVRLMKRCAYVVLPVSILFIKYYPQYGRRSSQWGGENMNIGIAIDKNMLGAICLILAMFLFWHLIQILRTKKSVWRRNELRLILFLLLMVGYLLRQAHSATSTISLVIGGIIIWLLGRRFVDKRVIGGYAVAGLILFIIAQTTFDVFNGIVGVSGHGSTFQSRVVLWHELLQVEINPIFGTGFEGFWLGERVRSLWEAVRWAANEAHNGYLETYLNLGLVGLLILIGLLVATFRKCSGELFRDFEWGRFRMGYLIAIIAYNWTEASFRRVSPLWFVFYIIAMEYRHPEIPSAEELTDTDQDEEDVGLVYAPEGPRLRCKFLV